MVGSPVTITEAKAELDGLVPLIEDALVPISRGDVPPPNPDMPEHFVTQTMKRLTVVFILAVFCIMSVQANRQDVALSTVHNALKALYKSTNGGHWINNTGWDTTNVPVSIWEFQQWFGLGVSNGKLDQIHLWHNRLRGPLPPELGNLATLESLIIDGNVLSDSIPPELGNLRNLVVLNLGNNEFTGSIPPDLANLTALEELTLQENPITGTIPPELGAMSALKSLSISETNLTGSIPPELGNLINLERLVLVENLLTGTIPPELGNLTKLEYLNLSWNQFTGPLPPELGNLPTLFDMYLSRNQLTGMIPRSFLQLPLFTFEFSSNAGLCAPSDSEFQTWLNNLQRVRGPNCPPAVSVEQETALPAEFTIRGNYPNPFRNFTNLRFDMPWAARVSVEVYDVTGRRVYVPTFVTLPGGYGHEIPLQGLGVAPGTYLYRLTVEAPEGVTVHTGSFVRVSR